MGDEKTSPHLAAWPRPGFLKSLPVRPYRASSAFIETSTTAQLIQLFFQLPESQSTSERSRFRYPSKVGVANRNPQAER